MSDRKILEYINRLTEVDANLAKQVDGLIETQKRVLSLIETHQGKIEKLFYLMNLKK